MAPLPATLHDNAESRRPAILGDFVIPVIDLARGRVVAAQGGDRRAYPPLATPFFPDADPLAVVDRLLSLFPFRNIYVADLDALSGGSPQTATVDALAALHPRTTLWLDAGLRAGAGFPDRLAQPTSIRPVIASEALASRAQADTLVAALAPAQPLLSIDHDAGVLRGALPARPRDLPIIDMDLSAVGSGCGPQRCLHPATTGAGGSPRYLAGGIRGADDIRTWHERGFRGALVATALYRGRLTEEDLRAPLTAR